MKIALATWSYDEHQGISRCVVELTSRLAKMHDVHVYAAEVATQARPGVHVHPVPLRYRGVHVNDWDFFIRAGRMLRRESFDLLHIHFPVWCPADVYTCHGLARMALRSFRQFPPEAGLEVPLLRMLPWYVQIPLYTYVVRSPHTVIAAVSRKTQADVAEESGRPLNEIAVVPNAVDLERFRPEVAARLRAQVRRELGVRDGQFVLLWVGNHMRHKGIRHALAALERLPERVILLAVGADSPHNVPELSGLISRMEGASRIRFIGVEAAIEKYYAAADALLFPSLYESFGLVVLEAMAMGLPVVTARTVGFGEEAIQDGINGFLVNQPWDVDAMAARVQRLLTEPGLAASMGSAARQTAQRYGWDEYVRLTEAVYEKALAARAIRGENLMPLDLAKIMAGLQIEFPPDLVKDAVHAWIDHRLTAEPPLLTASRDAYVEHHLARSLAAIALIPQTPKRGRLLELGSGIYLMTFLVEKLCNYDLDLVQYWGRPSGRYSSTLVNFRTGERKVMPFREFNGEIEPFPYADACFDVILNCDTIEHVLCNPVQMLAECHRVLKPGGLMVLTTPNVLRLDNVVRLLRGMNIYDKYVLESPSARHPREFTPKEIRMLLESVGFDVSQLETRDVTRNDIGPRARRLARWCLTAFAAAGSIVGREGDSPLQWRGEQIFLVAKRSRPVSRELPEFLFEAPGASRQLINALYGDGERK